MTGALKKSAAIAAGVVVLAVAARFIPVASVFGEGPIREHSCAENPQGEFQGVPCAAVLEASSSYAREIDPILAPKCYDCHGVVARLPLYSRMPPLSLLLAEDIREAKKDFNMSRGFPFMGKPFFVDDLHELKEVIEENEMPPAAYLVTHWGGSLSVEEKAAVLSWVEKTESALRAAKSSSVAE